MVALNFNDTTCPYPSDQTIVDLFEQQARALPGAEAVRCLDRAWSYRELNERANQLAWRLASLGVRPGQFVAVWMEHSLEVVATLLAILKAGAAFVPFDPATPAQRVAGILAQLRAAQGGILPILAAGPEQAAAVPAEAALVLPIRPGLPGCEPFRRTDLDRLAAPGGLAYVIYTSGSTGEPKGVMVGHRSLVNYLWWARRSYVPEPGLAWALFSSLAFDLTITTLFTPLISAGRILVYQDRAWSHGTLLLKVVADRAAQILKLTPAHLALVRDLDLGAMDLRVLIVGGEDFKTELAAAITRQVGHPVAIFNEYGPTEATVGCMIHRFEPDRDRGLSVPIGVPAANAQVFVLDEQFREAPDGEIGQLVLAGDGLAAGYLDRPELTAERFRTIPDPRDGGRQLRVYLTGDLARWTPEGQLVFLGRADHQVKIGGARIELGEIEARLLEHPEVARCAVVVAPRPAGLESADARLAAYYESGRPLAAQDLRGHLAAALPEFMVPSYFTHLPSLPLTANGKLDRAALPAPDLGRPDVSAAFVAQRTATEQRVAAIWKEALKLGEVGVGDDFFELGGKSLPAIRILAQIKRTLGVEIPISAFFAHPTIAQLAGLIDTMEAR